MQRGSLAVSACAKIPIVPVELSQPLNVVNRGSLYTEEVPRLVKGERRARTERTATARNEHPGHQQLTGWDRKTIRKYMQAAGLAPEYGPRSAPPSKLDAFKPYLEHRHPREATSQREEIDIARRARTEKGHKKGH